MSIQSEITRISDNIAAAYSALEEKGATVPEGATSDNLAEVIGAEVVDKSTVYTVYVSSSEPTSDVGTDGDIYIVRS